MQLKTAYYTVVIPLGLGALAAGREQSAAFTPAGEALGAAFQIRDDVLNCSTTRAATARRSAATYSKASAP